MNTIKELGTISGKQTTASKFGFHGYNGQYGQASAEKVQIPQHLSRTVGNEYEEGYQFTVIGCHISTLPGNIVRSGDFWEIAKPLRP